MTLLTGGAIAGLALLLTSLGAATPPARAQDAVEARTLLAMKPATIVSALGELGHQVRLVDRGDGDPVRIDAADTTYSLFLAQCDTSGCRLLQFRSCIAAPKGSADLAERWNSTNIYGRASRQAPGLMCIDSTLYAADRRISLASLRSHIEGMRTLMPHAQEFFLKG